MLHYVIAAGSPAEVRRVADRLPAALDATRLFDQQQVVHVSPTGHWALAARVASDPLCPERVLVRDDSVAVVNGPALSTAGAQPELLADVLERFRSPRALAAVAESLTGSYNFVGVTPEHGLRAFGDFTGMHPLYWAQAPGVVLVSNRSSPS